MVIKRSKQHVEICVPKDKEELEHGIPFKAFEGTLFSLSMNKAVVQAPVCRREGNLEFSFYLVPILSETSPSSKGILCALPHPINIFEVNVQIKLKEQSKHNSTDVRSQCFLHVTQG